MYQDRWERRRERLERRWERRRARLHSPGKNLATGLIFVAIGVIFLLGNMGYLDVREVFAFWPIILIVFGVVRIVESREDYGQTAGIFWVVVGLLFLLGSFGVIRMAFQELWPILLIGVGALMLWRAALVRRERPGLRNPGLAGSPDPADANTTSSNSVVSATAILGGVERRISSQDFRGGDVTAIMGGCNIDLRGASITPPHQPVLEVFALFGGIEIRIPEDWTVVSELEVILGGFDDRKINPPKDESKRFIIRGTVLMGGVEVRN
jgi:predicted membrane protein